MGIIINITIDDSDVNRITDGAISRMNDLTPAMRDIGSHMLESIDRNFEVGGRPKKWKRSYRAILEGGKTLVATARLKSSIKYRARPNEVEVGTNVIYGGIHQLGGTIRPKRKKALKFRLADGGFRTVKSVKMPARPFLVAQDEDIKYAEDAVRDYILGD